MRRLTLELKSEQGGFLLSTATPRKEQEHGGRLWQYRKKVLDLAVLLALQKLTGVVVPLTILLQRSSDLSMLSRLFYSAGHIWKNSFLHFENGRMKPFIVSSNFIFFLFLPTSDPHSRIAKKRLALF